MHTEESFFYTNHIFYTLPSILLPLCICQCSQLTQMLPGQSHALPTSALCVFSLLSRRKHKNFRCCWIFSIAFKKDRTNLSRHEKEISARPLSPLISTLDEQAFLSLCILQVRKWNWWSHYSLEQIMCVLSKFLVRETPGKCFLSLCMSRVLILHVHMHDKPESSRLTLPLHL